MRRRRTTEDIDRRSRQVRSRAVFAADVPHRLFFRWQETLSGLSCYEPVIAFLGTPWRVLGHHRRSGLLAAGGADSMCRDSDLVLRIEGGLIPWQTEC